MDIVLVKGDITKLKVDAIVNAANPLLLGGGGVDGAIHRAAGPELKRECLEIRKTRYPEGLPRGEAVITKGYNLPAKFVIHTAGPRFGIDDESLLEKCYITSLKLADEKRLESVAFPSISTGIYGFPIEKAVLIVKKILLNFKPKHLKKVYLVLHSDYDFKIYEEQFHHTKN